LVADTGRDAPIPGQPYSFGTLKRAQAEGDLVSLRSHGRRVLRVELGPDPLAGLRAVNAALADAADERLSSHDTGVKRAGGRRKEI
jgi:predicted exporter